MGVLGALGALVAALLVVIGSSGSASALPGGCTTTFQVASGSWSSGGNWSGGLPGPASVACIQGGQAVTLNGGTVHVSLLHIDGGLTVSGGASLFVDGAGPSIWGSLSQVTVSGSTFGGTGRVDTHGTIDFTGGAVLTSVPGGPGAAYGGTNGTLNIPGDGTVFVDDSALALRTRYNIGVFGDLLVQSDAFITADWGTGTTIAAGGRLELQDEGGYYQGGAVAGSAPSGLVNAGTIVKTGGGTTSIVDATYAQPPGGAIEVDCCATLAFAGGQVVSGKVLPSMSLGTGACGAGTFAVCGGSVDPAVDPSSAVLKLSNNAGNATNVQVQELAQPPDTTDSRAIGNDVFAHADSLVQDPTQAATITLRFSQADVMNTPLNEVQVGHISDAGVMLQTPDCSGQDLPPGAKYCIVRPVTRTAQNTFVTIKTIETSRWRLRRTVPGENFAQTASSAPQSFAVKPGDGSVVQLSWAAPANDGGAAVSSYNVLLDGKQVATTTTLSAGVPNAGPGEHTVEVVAVNAIGASGKAGATVTLKKLSKPRGAKALKGAKGGKKTAGLKWKAPASAGGLQLKTYQVVVVNAKGKVVLKKKVAASKHKFMVKLDPGRYRFKVRAQNLDKYGPFSAWTDLVRPR